MLFYGGFLGVVIVSWLYCCVYGIFVLCMVDVLGVVMLIGLGLGWLVNFINVELWGCLIDLLWGVIFFGEVV